MRARRYLTAYLFIAPFYVLFLIFGLGPILFSFYLGFAEWNGTGPLRWIGAQNYAGLLSDGTFVLAVENTLWLWVGHAVPMLPVALALALLLNLRWLRGRAIARAAVYLPNVTGVVPVALAFTLILDPKYGLLSFALRGVGLSGLPWLTDPTYSKWGIILFVIWRATGWYVVVFLAGLQSVDPFLYEAAMVDGAGAWSRFRHVTLPGIAPVLLFAVVIDTIGSMRAFTEPTILTNGGPANSSLTLAMYLYANAFEYAKFGYAAAISYAIFAITLVAALLQLRLWQRQMGD
ncbi:MAG TPA: sugar ABC transporter permease [Chloroflexota bacterium]|nr:sugar ABC transporter permease [Chloroflexota bacterium]